MVNDGHLKLFITCSYSPNSPKWRNWWFCSPGTWGNLGCERVRRTQCQCFPNCFLQYPLVFSRSYSHIYNINSWFSHQKWLFPIALFFVCLPEGKSSCRQEPGASALWWWWNPTVRVGTLAAWGQGAAAWRRIQSQSQRSLWSLGFFSNEMKWHDMTWIFMMQKKWDVISKKSLLQFSPKHMDQRMISVRWLSWFSKVHRPSGPQSAGHPNGAWTISTGLWPLHLGRWRWSPAGLPFCWLKNGWNMGFDHGRNSADECWVGLYLGWLDIHVDAVLFVGL